jgi:hypothetical protein
MTISQQRNDSQNGSGIVTDKLTRSRADLQYLIEDGEKRERSDEFPRSKTMKLLTSGGGVALLAIAAGAVLLYRPSLATRVVRTMPVGPLLRSLAMNVLSRR